MAYGRLPKPGTEYGPCEDEQCGHSQCEQSRQMAAAICPRCGEPIEYERNFCRSGDNDSELWHWVCAIEEADERREKMLAESGNG